MKLSTKTHQIIVISLLLMSMSVFAQEEKGWFSGISALPYTTVLGGIDNGAGNSVFSGRNRPNLIGGEGSVPLGKRWNMLGRLGTVSPDRPWLSNGSSMSMDGILPYDQMGLGISYDLGSHLLLQGNLDRYQLKYNRINGDNGLDLLTIGLKYRF
ncbi:hypothetical protein LHV13_03735 [Ferrovum sp. PN-J185]|uniref:hypothetical protein n=2 Tax=Ferrovum sp. PN-J185 TaxID=1356306 RepID=UPI000791BBD6|nr:hypothetical protein [Ferrovum sp. PN-J185]KXW56001.1 hypothetical protein FV185_11620 [Ferrovum sp. PN-J185]MCC6068287.1 hypothetical protein [Ferrovum sp. PN-J185]MDE1892278.1 hypothetical protein [Betaproteobacteria bacterium]MDE2056676.1 hypothetical protein [Betaproteobacteria bacterium]